MAGARGTPGPPRGRGRDLPTLEDPVTGATLWGSAKITGKMGVKIGIASSYLESALTIQWSRDQPSWRLISGLDWPDFGGILLCTARRRTEASARRSRLNRESTCRATVVGKNRFRFSRCNIT